MRRVFSLTVGLVVALACAGAASPAITFVFKGNGWGHGIGLAQYGAKGLADAGKDYDEILQHYYRGTTLGAAGVSRVRVLLAEGQSSLAISSPVGFTVTAGGKTYNLLAGTHTLKTDMKIVSANGATRTLTGTATFKPGGSPLRLNGKAYRGRIDVRKAGGRLSARNDIGVQQYLRGVVAWEMPSSWHMEALKAQAVIARTYGLVSRKPSGWFDLYPDTRSQVYGGVAAEHPRTDQAVSATAGEVVTSDGSFAWTFYHSTSGGKTAAKHHEWGQPSFSYLTSVPDPYSKLSPHHRWGPTDAEVDCVGSKPDCVWTGKQIKQKLGSNVPAGVRDMTVSRNGSSRVSSVSIVGSGGAQNTVSGATMRSLLGLRSTWFTVGVLRINPAKRTIDAGERTQLTILVRSVGNVTLQRKRGSGPWEVQRTGVSGTLTLSVKPPVTTRWRLSSPSGKTAAVKVNVRPQLRFAAAQRAGSLLGVTDPGLEGTAVAIQRETPSGAWELVGTASVQADGTWRAHFELTPGVYRARSVAGPAAAAGVSPTVTVVQG
ncbi:MAG TPA: SpoIID/LytB domain-containing protein [Gaiellaceae bacterium]|nr:SpoIID/LytB domain-containing protein [Gaiellaceae bacterium]